MVQVLSWLFLLVFSLLTFLCLLPAVAAPAQPALLTSLALLYSLHLLAHLTAVLLDPADPALRTHAPARQVPGTRNQNI